MCGNLGWLRMGPRLITLHININSPFMSLLSAASGTSTGLAWTGIDSNLLCDLREVTGLSWASEAFQYHHSHDSIFQTFPKNIGVKGELMRALK